MDDPYEFVIQGRLQAGREVWFEDLTITHTKSEDDKVLTILTGVVRDQAALHGVLAKIRDLGLPLLSVSRLGARNNDQEE
nr:hypothetical protein [Anaerolineae bacterium]